MKSTSTAGKHRRKRINKNRKNAYICIGVFAFFVAVLITLIILTLTKVIAAPTLPAPVLGLLGLVFFLPAIAAIFFMGRYYNDKKRYKLGDILTITSVVYMIFAIIQTVLVLAQVY